MVNTVGSYKNKHEPKQWSLLKQGLILTKKQYLLCIGSLLGDATMRIGKGACNANFKIDHGLKQKEYVFWKYRIIKSFVRTPPKISVRKNQEGNMYPKSWWFRTLRHPELTKLYNDFYTKEGYRNGKKIVPKWLIREFNEFIAAILIMDDGSYNKGIIDISTYSFSKKDIKILVYAFSKKLGVRFRAYRDRDKGYRIYANKEETKKLIEKISPYIIPEMIYKIGFYNPVTTRSSINLE